MAQDKEDRLTLKVGVSFEELVASLHAMKDEDREWFLENLLAATSPDYLESIREAREDYREGRTVDAEGLFRECADVDAG